MTFNYRIYGLQIRSTRQIRLLKESRNERIDLEVIWTTDAAETPDNLVSWERVTTKDLSGRKGISLFQSETEQGICSKIYFETDNRKLCFLLGAEKSRVWIIHDKDEPASDLDSNFVGPVLGCILRLRGTLCLHSSVININGKAIALTGKKRSGKSTSAAAFAKAGFQVLSDDLGVITEKDGSFFMEPGYSKIRLRPAPLAKIHPEDPLLFPMVYTHRNSRYSELAESFCETALPLGAVYQLESSYVPDQAPFVESVPLTERMVKMNENTFGNYIITKSMRKHEFGILGRLTQHVPFRRLLFGHDLNTLHMQIEAVLEDYSRLQDSNLSFRSKV